jgi:hypothetical protein
MLGGQFVLACAVALTACGTGQTTEDVPQADIARVKDVGSSFGPSFKVTDVAPTGVDPKLLEPQTLPPGMKFDPPDCFGATETIPPGIKGNMAAVTAEGDGNRFITMAVETSEPVPVNRPANNCQKVSYAGGGVQGLIEVVAAPVIDGVDALGIRRVVGTSVDGQLRAGEVYTYTANFGPFLVIVTANPLVAPGQPVARVNTERARDLLSRAVAAVKG